MSAMKASDGQAAGESFEPATRSAMVTEAVVRVHLLRHGEVEGFERRLVRGQLDVDLSENGRRQTEALAHWFAEAHPTTERVLTSDLSRCAQLARALGERLNVPVEARGELREQHMGSWQGRTWDDITAELGAAINDYWDDYLNARPPEGESMRQVFERVGTWWDGLLERHANERIAVVTHAGVIRAVLCRALHVPAGEALRFAPAVASHTELIVSAPGAVVSVLGERPWTFDAAGRRLCPPRVVRRALP